jgi:hypothetical protein
VHMPNDHDHDAADHDDHIAAVHMPEDDDQVADEYLELPAQQVVVRRRSSSDIRPSERRAGRPR